MVPTDQFRSGAVDGKLSRLLHLGLENDPVSVLPHLRHKRLARIDGAGETDLDVLKGAESAL